MRGSAEFSGCCHIDSEALGVLNDDAVILLRTFHRHETIFDIPHYFFDRAFEGMAEAAATRLTIS